MRSRNESRRSLDTSLETSLEMLSTELCLGQLAPQLGSAKQSSLSFAAGSSIQVVLDFHYFFIDFHRFSFIFIDFHGFSLIFIDFYGFPLFFIDFRRFRGQNVGGPGRPWEALRTPENPCGAGLAPL